MVVGIQLVRYASAIQHETFQATQFNLIKSSTVLSCRLVKAPRRCKFTNIQQNVHLIQNKTKNSSFLSYVQEAAMDTMLTTSIF